MKHIKTFDNFLNESKKLTPAEIKKALKDAARIMNVSGYDTINDAALDMEQAIDAGVEDDPEINAWLKKYGDNY